MTCTELQAQLTASQSQTASLMSNRDAAVAAATAAAALSTAASTAAMTAQSALDGNIMTCMNLTSQLHAQNCPGYGA